MSISEVSRAGPAQGVASFGPSSSAAAEGGRQKVSSGGNTPPPEAATGANKSEKPAAPSREATQEAVAIVAEFLQHHSRSLQFEVDEHSGMEIVTVLDGETGEVIRQFPSEEIVASARYISDSISDVTTGVLLDQKS